MKFEEMKEEELKETLELVKRVFDEFEAPDYTGEGVTNFYKFIAYDSILEQLKNNFKIFKFFFLTCYKFLKFTGPF